MKLSTGIETKINKKGRVNVLSNLNEDTEPFKSFHQIEEDKYYSEEQDKQMKRLFENIGEAINFKN